MLLSKAVTPSRILFAGGAGAIDPASVANARFALDTYSTDFISLRTAAQFTASNSEYLTTASADFDFGDDDSFTMGGWFYNNNIAVNSGLMGKWDPSDKAYALYQGFATVRGITSSNGLSSQLHSAGTITASTWNFIVFVRNATTDETLISINGGVFTSLPINSALNISASEFRIGYYDSGTPNYLDGRADSCFVYGRALNILEVQDIYNGADGQNYSEIDKTDLISYWPLNETSGIRYDSHGSNHLTDNNTVTFEDGKVVDSGTSAQTTGKAAQFVDANSEFLNNSSAALKMSDADFSFVANVYLDTTSASVRGIMGTYGGSTDRSVIMYNFGTTIRVGISNDGGSGGWITIDSGIVATTGAWYTVAFYHDSVNNEVGISINKEAFVTAAFSGGPFTTTADFQIGKMGTGDHMDGRIQNAIIFNKVLSQSEADNMVGKPLEDIDLSEALAAWKLNEASGTRADFLGNYDLTDNNTVTQADGFAPEYTTLYDAAYFVDRTGNGNHFDQSSHSARGQYTLSDPSVLFDGAAVYYDCVNGSTPFEGDSQGEIIFVYERTSAGDTAVLFCAGQDGVTSNDFLFEHIRNGGSTDGGLQINTTSIMGYQARDLSGQKIIVSISTNGARTRISINGVEVPIQALFGADAGEFVDTIAAGSPDVARIGRRMNTVYGDLKFKAASYYSAELSASTREGIIQFYNSKYSCFTPITNPKTYFGADLLFYWNLPNIDLETFNNGFVGYQSDDLDLINLLMDGQASPKTVTNLKTFDFSTDEDGLTATQGTFSANQTVNGSTGWLKFQPNSNASNHSANYSNALINDEPIRVKGQLYLEGDVDGWILYQSSSNPRFDFYNEGNGLVSFDIYTYSTQAAFNIFASNDVSSAVDLSGGALYIASGMTIDRIDEISFFGDTSSAIPGVDHIDKVVEFNGVDEWLDDEDGEFFSAVGGLTEGEIIVGFRDDAGSGVTIRTLCISDGTGNNLFSLGYQSTNVIRIRKAVGGGSSNVDFGAAQNRDEEVELTYSSDDLAYKCFENYREADVSAGTDNGDFPGDNGGNDRVEYGREAGAYYASGLFCLVALARQQTHEERRQFKKFRDLQRTA